MMQHTKWNLDHKTVLPMILRPKYTNNRDEIVIKSITVDNVFEFGVLRLTTKKIGVKLYKCDPYCYFQIGTNERMNAMVRRFISKRD